MRTQVHIMELRPIPGYEGYYSITRNGNVFSHDREITHRNGTKQEIPGRWLKTVHPDSSQYFLNRKGSIQVVNANKIIKEVFDPKHEFGERPTVIKIE